MAITTLPTPILWPMPIPQATTGAPSFGSSSAMNAVGDRIAFVLRVPKAGTLNGFGFRAASISAPPGGIRLSFQDIDPATGFPDGVVDQFQDVTSLSSNTWIEVAAMTHDGTAGGTKRTVAAGDWLGCVIDFVAFVSGSFSITHTLGVPAGSQELLEVYLGDATSGTYGRNTVGGGAFALAYADGTYGAFVQWTVACTAINTRTYNTGTTPDERGIRFVPTVPMAVDGAWVRLDLDGACNVVLYDAASAVLASVSLDPDIKGLTNGNTACIRFASPVTLTAGATYRLTVLPTSATSLSIFEFSVNTAAQMAAVPGGASMYLTTRSDGGTWTDTATERPWMGLIIGGMDAGGGVSVVASSFPFIG